MLWYDHLQTPKHTKKIGRPDIGIPSYSLDTVSKGHAGAIRFSIRRIAAMSIKVSEVCTRRS